MLSCTKYSLVPCPDALRTVKSEYTEKHPKSFEAFNKAAQVMPGGGSRHTISVDPFPLFITGGKGHYVTDIDGHEYLDLAGDMVSGLYGKNNPIIRDAIVAALDSGIQLGMHSQKEAEFANLIRERLPSMELIRYANSGTEAGMISILAAMHYTKRSKVVMFRNGYHGGIITGFKLPPDGPAVLRVPFDFVFCPYNDLEKTREIVKSIADDAACIIVEPMQGAGGCIAGTPEFLRGLRSLATKVGAVLIFDEVQTARLAFHGLQGVHGITPDMTTIGKFFGGGMAGWFGQDYGHVISRFDSRDPASVKVGGTFNNSIMTMSAGIAALTHVMTKPAMDKVNSLGDLLRHELAALFQKLGAPYVVSGIGSINQIYCVLPDEEAVAGLQLLYFGMLGKGIAIAPRGLLALTLVAEESDIYHILKVFEEVLQGDLFEPRQ
ncbi:pyridoxal phosphate-dependent transferase [Naematelia encephala]|uniref:Pyridoxal phosphate-dependent transferase n=1 Tax=Naematelia encephala TaxID=71784 RepID=A0A1Y2AP20_9TREE|nr:pyridoxal phosphate-dependent transferase [Naematelia encephala]